MDYVIALMAAIVGYLLGSISFARLMTKILAPEQSIDDLSVKSKENEASTESKEDDLSQLLTGFGATRASIILGGKWGFAIGLLDMLKVIVPMVIFWFLYPEENYFLIVSVTGLIGHNWPIFHGFKGGRGFSVIYGSLLLIDFVGAIVVVILGLLFGMGIFGTVMIGVGGWLVLMIPWFQLRTADPAFWIYALVLNTIFIIATIPETRLVRRLKKSGKYEEYQENLLEVSPMWRGMKKMDEKIQSPIRRGVLILLGIIILIPVYLFILA
jgi:glycerol-3-phosphate acyltransferase PlsY